jgi:hypothetical protein
MPYLPTRMIEERVNAGFRDSAGWMGAISRARRADGH